MRRVTILLFSIATLLTNANLALAESMYLLSGSMLVRTDTDNPGVILASLNISGLQAGESIRSIDFRPQNGVLYGLGSTSRLYVISPTTGVATQVGSGTFTPALAGSFFGMDFNPFTDRIRVVSDSSQNIRIDPNTGAATLDSLLHTSMQLAGAVAAAHTNNVSGAAATTLYVIDPVSDVLYRQGSDGGTPASPDDGLLTEVGPLGVNTSSIVGFDISPSGTAYVALRSTGETTSSLYTLNLATGATTLISNFLAGGLSVNGLAVGSPATGCTLDVDGNNALDALTDGLLMIRALFGLTGNAVTNNALGSGATRATWSQLRQYMNSNCGTNFAP